MYPVDKWICSLKTILTLVDTCPLKVFMYLVKIFWGRICCWKCVPYTCVPYTCVPVCKLMFFVETYVQHMYPNISFHKILDTFWGHNYRGWLVHVAIIALQDWFLCFLKMFSVQTCVLHTYVRYMFSQDTWKCFHRIHEMFSEDTCVWHMCRIHVWDTCILMCSMLQIYLWRLCIA